MEGGEKRAAVTTRYVKKNEIGERKRRGDPFGPPLLFLLQGREKPLKPCAVPVTIYNRNICIYIYIYCVHGPTWLVAAVYSFCSCASAYIQTHAHKGPAHARKQPERYTTCYLLSNHFLASLFRVFTASNNNSFFAKEIIITIIKYLKIYNKKKKIKMQKKRKKKEERKVFRLFIVVGAKD